MNSQNKTKIMGEASIMLALATILSLIKIWQMPLGGSITCVSMLPICIISYRHGMKWGFLTSFVYSLIQLFLGITMSGLLGWGLTASMLIGCILFDYIVPYSVIGISGIFRNKGRIGWYAGMVLAFMLRLMSHFVSGYVIFKNFEQWQLFGRTIVNSPILYSICYNAFYLLPELIITLIVTVLLQRTPVMSERFFTGSH